VSTTPSDLTDQTTRAADRRTAARQWLHRLLGRGEQAQAAGGTGADRRRVVPRNRPRTGRRKA
jgi:hypothetical protein